MRTIRHYERIGLLPEPERTCAGYRLDRADDEDRLRGGDPPCDDVASVIEQRLDEVNERLRHLSEFKRELGQLRDRIRAAGPRPNAGGPTPLHPVRGRRDVRRSTPT